MKSPYERIKPVFSPEIVQKLHDENRAERFKRYPELQAMDELFARLAEPRQQPRKSR